MYSTVEFAARSNVRLACISKQAPQGTLPNLVLLCGARSGDALLVGEWECLAVEA